MELSKSPIVRLLQMILPGLILGLINGLYLRFMASSGLMGAADAGVTGARIIAYAGGLVLIGIDYAVARFVMGGVKTKETSTGTSMESSGCLLLILNLSTFILGIIIIMRMSPCGSFLPFQYC